MRRSPRTRLSAAFFMLAGVIASTAPAWAERVEAPLELMFAPDTAIIAGKLARIDPAGHVVIERKDVIAAGKAHVGPSVSVRVAASALDGLEPGARYVIAYSIFQRDPRRPTGMILNPAGAVVLDSPGIHPALFRDTPALRAILAAGASEDGRGSRRLRDRLIAALEGRDPKLKALAAAEFGYEPDLPDTLRDRDRAVLERLARDAKTPLEVRTLLLDAAARRQKEIGDWSGAVALQIVTTTPVDGYSDKAPDPVDLVMTAFGVLDRFAVKMPADAAARWLKNPHPPVVEQACLTLRRLVPAQERPAIEHALADPKLPDATRRFLNGHLRQLDRLLERQRDKARKEGSG